MSLLPADSPILQPSDDLLNRSSFVHTFVKQLATLDASSGFVVGVLGPWGSGKTSFLNLARKEFEQEGMLVLDFNPWMFSGADQLVESFFHEISAQLRLKPELHEVGQLIEAFGDVFADMGWLPVVGAWVERGRKLSSSVGKVLQHKKSGVTAMRDKVSKALKKLDKPLIVVLDDIDRLSTPEIRDIFKLVRLTASFPNIIYILAFDRVRVEQALGEQGISGRDYLEKILQLVADLPVIPDHVLTSQIESSLKDALEGISNPGPFIADEWPDILLDIVRPLIRNMRDVRRYALAVHGTVAALGGQVSQGDVFALEAVRLFMPDVFHQLYSMRDALTTQSRRFMPEQLRPQLDMLLAHDKEREAVVTNLLRLIFPYGYGYSRGTSYSTDDIAVWQRDRRVADDTCFDLYFERVPSDGIVALGNAERAVQLFSDSDRLEGFLRSLRQKELQDALASIDAVVKSVPVEQAHAVSVVLLNMLPSAMEGELLGGLRITSNNHVARIVGRFLLAVTNGKDRESILRRVLHDVTTLSAKLEVMTLLRSRNERLADWLPEATAVALDAQWRAEVREMLQDAEYDWKREYALLRVLMVAKRFASANEPVLHIPASATFTYALLLSARGESSITTLDRRSSKRTPTLAWDLLVEIYGDEALLCQRIGELDGMQTDDRAGVIGLAQSYVDGNAPEMRDE